MTTNQIKDQDITECIENCALDNKYWFNQTQIAAYLEVPLGAIHDSIKDSETIVINSLGELTTRELYKQKTPFLDKLMHTLKNKID